VLWTKPFAIVWELKYLQNYKNHHNYKLSFLAMARSIIYSTFKVGKECVVANYHAWLHGWRDFKNMEFDVLSRELRELKRKQYNLDEELKGLEYQPLVTISKEF
jgi:hypothetical protein